MCNYSSPNLPDVPLTRFQQALARAVYAQRDVIILDDVLSGIDAATENHIFHSLLGEKGLLRHLGATVILVSSSSTSNRSISSILHVTDLGV